MSKMTYKRKCEIVEALKKNWTCLAGLNPDEREIIYSVRGTEDLIRLRDGGDWTEWNGDKKHPINDQRAIFRIHHSYTVPIEPPEGCKMVTDEEREKYEFPAD